MRGTPRGRRPAGFDARFSALWRRYAYRIADDPATVDPLTRNHVLTWSKPLDLDAMNEAADLFLGEHDFASFCRRREGATTIRTLLDLRWVRDPSGVAVASVRADAFCHSMVRAAGGLPARRRRGPPPGRLGRGGAAGHAAGTPVTVAHAHGLTLEQVAYPCPDVAWRSAPT